MKLLRSLSLVFSLAVIGVPASAAVPLEIYDTNLSVSFGTVGGKLLLHPDMLTFLDVERPETSMAVSKQTIRSLSNENDVVTLELSEPVNDRAGRTTRMILRFATPSEAAAVNRWYQGEVASAGREAATRTAQAENVYSAKRDKFFGSTWGQLIITDDRLIFESTDNASDSRRWEFTEIKELKQKNPYEIEIKPFRGDNYNLKLSGKGLDADKFNQLARKVAQARSRR